MFEEDLLDEEVKKKKRRVLAGLFILLLLGAVVALPLAELLELPPLSPTPASGVAAGTPAHAVTSVPTPGVAATTTGPPEAMPAPQLTATAAVAGTMPAATEETVGGAGGGMLVTPTVLPTATGAPIGTSQTPETPAPGVTATTTGPPEAIPAPQLTATAAVAGTMPAATEETVGGAGGGTLVTPTVLPTATGMPAAASPTLEMPTPTGPSQLPAAGADAGQGLNWPALGLVAALLGTLMLGAGYALRNTRPRQW